MKELMENLAPEMTSEPADSLFERISQKLDAQERLTFADGVALYQTPDLFHLGQLARKMTLDRHGDQVYYSINRHINYTNICKFDCKFCGFKRWHGQEGAYTHDVNAVVDLAKQALKENATEIHIVGGIHPDLAFDYFLEMLQRIRQACPTLHIKAFTAVEILDLSHKSGFSMEETLLALREAGLDSLPGGGAEILDDDYFRQVCRSKSKPDTWCKIHRSAHQLGMMTNCTMLYGFIESIEQRVRHLIRLREIQDEALALGKGRFQCFVPLPYLKPAWISRHSKEHQQGNSLINAVEDLRTTAICRLMLDNVAYHKAFWPMQGVNLSQIALAFGANDLDGTVRQYTIVDKGYDNQADTLQVERIRELISEVGSIPVQRDGFYRPIHTSF